MSDGQNPLSDVPPEAWAEGLLQRQCALLEQMAEAALGMAQAIERKVGAEPAPGASEPPVDIAAAAMAFSRVSRAGRMAVMLQARLVGDARAAKAKHAPLAANDEAPDPAARHRSRVHKVVARVARAAHPYNEPKVERLMAEAGERLEDDDIYGEVMSRPVGELVTLICRDLGLSPDWTRLSEEAWARDEAAAGDPRSPFFTSPMAGGAEEASGVRHPPSSLVLDSG